MSTVVPLHRPVSSTSPARAEPLWREAVGTELRRERAERAERLVDVADRAGVSVQYLSEIERGRKEASSEVLAAVAGALDLTVAELAGRTSTRLGRPSAPNGTVRLAA
ncbi:helix-turn-helix transcriptional regulator [Phycicoccus sp. CSK15P-2]|uniref:helix-turn-helix domain-containing protein n=1 Tax=Phycicoccus sp. CSK15P-2 TaxID=2807627 RepID=UPI00194F382A|nr:helix-turn-helix transcriptional regulator [Phycicoccus sp. CSK15P-2]MBM6404364.1 helix-turn-helix transcriptional regulator [Phycicoccus sp. CSK15P-2]